jgi:hypothetical protein
MEKDAGFTPQRFTFNEYFGIDTINDTPDYMRDLIAVILRMDMTNIIDVKYWLSPDEGIVIIYYICYNMAPENKCFYGKISFYPIFAYTGLVQYSLNQQDKNKLKETNKLKKTLSRASTFFRTMYTR